MPGERRVSDRRPFLIVAATLVLAGCAAPLPERQKPNAGLPGQYPFRYEETAAAATAKPAADLDWREFFGDERTRRLITLALLNNRDLRVAVLSIEQARALVQVRRADEWPTVNAGVSALRQPRTSTTPSLYTAGVQVTAWEVDLFDRVGSLGQVALAQFLASEEARKAVQISLVANVASAALALQADAELLAVTRQTLATREDSMKLVRLRVDNGVASELDLRQAESLLEAAKVALAQQERQLAQDGNALSLLLGQPVPADLPDAVPLDQTPMVADLPAGLPSDLLERRPDLRQAARALQAAEANVSAARAAFFPRITLTGSLGTASTELSGLFKAGTFAWSFAPQLLAPIFDAGRNRGNLASAQAARDIALAQYERAIQGAFREVADALAGRATYGEQLRAQKAQTTAEEVRFKLADLRYRNGVASYLDLLDAQRALFAARQAVVQTQLAQAQNLVTVYKVLGGGWSDTVR